MAALHCPGRAKFCGGGTGTADSKETLVKTVLRSGLFVALVLLCEPAVAQTMPPTTPPPRPVTTPSVSSTVPAPSTVPQTPSANRQAPVAATTASVDLAESDYISLVRSDTPFAYWPLNDVQGTPIHDEVGSTTGSPVGGVSAVLGNPFGASGTATRFDGNATRVQPSGLCTGVSFDGLRLQPAGSFSVEAWVKTTDPDGVIFRQRFYGYLLWVTGGRASFETNLGPTGYRNIVTGGLSVADGEWHHLVGVHEVTSSGARSLLYVDGELAASVVAPASAGTSVLYDGAPDPAALGRDGSACDSRLTSLKGNLSHVAIYPRALPAPRVRAHHGPEVQLGTDVSVRNGKTFAYVSNVFPTGTQLGFSVVAGPSTGATGFVCFRL